eukprot:467044-Rhodomonas_salina.2
MAVPGENLGSTDERMTYAGTSEKSALVLMLSTMVLLRKAGGTDAGHGGTEAMTMVCDKMYDGFGEQVQATPKSSSGARCPTCAPPLRRYRSPVGLVCSSLCLYQSELAAAHECARGAGVEGLGSDEKM